MADAPYTSPLAAELSADVLGRFERYVRIDTQSQPDAEVSPSTPGQLDLGHVLADELRAAGLDDAELDSGGYVMATLAGNVDGGGPVVGLIAHLDTSPEAPGSGVEPVVHRGYDGATIELPRQGTRLEPEAMPELRDKAGHDLVTSSGDTLLGADDKAGVAEIMAAAAYLASHPERPRATIRVAFTPDEEIGEGAKRFDIERFGAKFAYTLDGSELGELQDETFSAYGAAVTVRGVEVHPGVASGKMVNALRLAARIVAALPSERLTPETTAGREGFIHPYALSGTPARAELRLIVRDFDEDRLEQHLALLERTAQEIVESEPRARLEFGVRRQYRNMRSYLEPYPEVVRVAEAALRAEGIEPIRTPIRGGTDGSILSERGLPTPNIFTGGHEFHSLREWASLQEMAAAAATVVRLAEAWAKQRA